MLKAIKNILIVSSMITLANNASASTLSFMIKDDDTTESYLKLKNTKDPVYLELYCNNYIYDVQVSIKGLNQSHFFDKNTYNSKVIFNKQYSNEEWRISYNEIGSMNLVLKNNGIDFVKKLKSNGRVLIDMKELKSIKLFDYKDKSSLSDKITPVFDNCAIFF